MELKSLSPTENFLTSDGKNGMQVHIMPTSTSRELENVKF